MEDYLSWLAITWLVKFASKTKENGDIDHIRGSSGQHHRRLQLNQRYCLVEGTRVTIVDFGSMLGDPNDLALVLMFPLAFTTSQASTSESHYLNELGGFVCVLLLAAIIATQSRGDY